MNKSLKKSIYLQDLRFKIEDLLSKITKKLNIKIIKNETFLLLEHYLEGSFAII